MIYAEGAKHSSIHTQIYYGICDRKMEGFSSHLPEVHAIHWNKLELILEYVPHMSKCSTKHGNHIHQYPVTLNEKCILHALHRRKLHSW